ncbi:hypothetical protein TELCIR_10057 [Teladorsagia circumcincta]|uniref:Uncharacterized protein n=1 Tax=Teladorsagia circumcincta TaxID=45464 RepID=A0A2G9UD52_TELCI|nr:hypothetical protein TELCIR_10057 [Teladorsagia circumcincta]
MDNRNTAAAVKKPSVVRVTPIPRRSQPTPAISTKSGSPIHVPHLRGGSAEGTLVRRPQISRQKVDQAERARHVEIPRRSQPTPTISTKTGSPIHVPHLRGGSAEGTLVRRPQISRQKVDQAERARHVEVRFLIALFNGSMIATDLLMRNNIQVGGSRLAELLSILLGESQSETNLRGPIQRILKEIDNILREDVELQLRNEQEQSDRRLENLTMRFEQTLRQRESSHLREIAELHGRIDYLQDQLRATREMNESLEQRLDNTNSELLERSQNIGCTMAEIEVENERDELRMEFDKNLQKLRQSNQRRHHAIVAELDEAEDEILT